LRFIGDIHGKYSRYISVAREAEETVQIGDFGIGFPGDISAHADRVAEEFRKSGNHSFIRGNHDNPAACRTATGWIPDGHVDPRGIMYVGGAWSIDQQFRTVGVDWWEDEELSSGELEKVMTKYCEVRPRIMVTHDAPHDIAGDIFFGPRFAYKSQYRTRTASYLQMMFDEHQPELWIFGHWHETLCHVQGNTRFHCIGELDYLDVAI
jgi:Icc-related predicted phosphoesterase